MSVKESAKHLVKLLEKLPEDRIKHFASFKQNQLTRFSFIAGLPVSAQQVKNNKSLSDIVTSTFAKETKPADYKEQLYNKGIVEQQISSVSNLLSNKYANLYPVEDKLTKPKGNPNYYTRLLNDLNKGGSQKESLFSALKTVVTGKY